jgi:hypothetical protein
MRPFRFLATAGDYPGFAELTSLAHKAEAVGCSAFVLPDCQEGAAGRGEPRHAGGGLLPYGSHHRQSCQGQHGRILPGSRWRVTVTVTGPVICSAGGLIWFADGRGPA